MLKRNKPPVSLPKPPRNEEGYPVQSTEIKGTIASADGAVIVPTVPGDE